MSDYIQKAVISHSTALKVVGIAIAEGEKLGVSVSAAVVDSDMNLVAFIKTDTATAHSAETSRRKANTAASTQKPTGWMTDSLETTLPMATGNLLTNIPGGYPIKVENIYIGGLGIAGGTVDQDKAIAVATIKAIGADLS